MQAAQRLWQPLFLYRHSCPHRTLVAVIAEATALAYGAVASMLALMLLAHSWLKERHWLWLAQCCQLERHLWIAGVQEVRGGRLKSAANELAIQLLVAHTPLANPANRMVFAASQARVMLSLP
jgi:hypothetical protein